jgi:hypothetical protein
MQARKLRSFLSCLGAVLFLASASHSQAPVGKRPAHDPEALRLFGDVVKAYKSLAAYADQGETSLSPPGGKPSSGTQKLTFVRPNKIDFKSGPIRLLSDGKDMVTIFEGTKKYMVQAAPPVLDLETLTKQPAARMLNAGPMASASPILLELLMGDAALNNIVEQGAERLSVEADRVLGGKAVKCMSIQGKEGGGLRLFIDPETRLARRIESLGSTASWNAGELATGSPKNEAFQFQPPKGFLKVYTFNELLSPQATCPDK